MDHREEFARIFPKTVEDNSKIDHLYLLNILRESVRKNDIEASTIIVNGRLLTVNGCSRRIGGLISHPPETNEMKDHVLEEVISLYERKLIDTYDLYPWMFRGFSKDLPKIAKGSLRNPTLIKYLKDPDDTYEIEFTKRSKGRLTITLRELKPYKYSEKRKNELLEALREKNQILYQHLPFKIENKWYILPLLHSNMLYLPYGQPSFFLYFPIGYMTKEIKNG
jgi:hypothetical protein